MRPPTLGLLLVLCLTSLPARAQDDDIVTGSSVLRLSVLRGETPTVTVEFLRRKEGSPDLMPLGTTALNPAEWRRLLELSARAMQPGEGETRGEPGGPNFQKQLGTVQNLTVWKLHDSWYGNSVLFTEGKKTLGEINEKAWLAFTRQATRISAQLPAP